MTLYTSRIRAAWVDTDAARVVHFSNYFRYCERVEEELLNMLGLDFEAIEEKYKVWFPRVSASCKYLWPIKFNQVVRVELTNLEVGEKHLRYNYKLYNESEKRLAAECEIVVVAASRELKKAVKIPEEVVEKVKELISKLKTSPESSQLPT